LKIQDAVHSYKILMQRKSIHCEVLTGKLDKVEKMVKALRKEVSEMEQDKVEQKKELCKLSFKINMRNYKF
jgi:hypothetical protein